MARNRVFKTEHYELRACGCRSWFCPNCCRALGMGLRKRVVKAVEKWQSVMMFTLTFDPELFEGPEECYRYARKKRVVAILIRRLAEKGFLHSKQYFAVWEYHKSGWPHIHLLVDASFVPFETVCEIWNRNRPKEAGAVKEGRPGFGGVRFSAPKFSSKAHAANYATKYLIKAPEEGWPEWVMWFEGQIHRYSTSRGFFQDGPKFKGGEEIETATVPHGLSCFCEVCREGWEPGESEIIVERPPKPKREPRKAAERVAECGQGCAVFKVEQWHDEAGEVVERCFEYVKPFLMGFERACLWAMGAFAEGRFLELSQRAAAAVLGYERPENAGERVADVLQMPDREAAKNQWLPRCA